jgi:hypothetical protein
VGACIAAELAMGGCTRMKLDLIFGLLKEASAKLGHTEFVIIGSLSVLALEGLFDVPPDMTMSNDVDCYTLHDPERIFDIVPLLGENSPRHLESGYFLDAVTPALPSLPDGWRARLSRVERDGVVAWFLDPNDAALSKYARGEPRDRRWIRAGIRAGVVSLPMVKSRFKSVGFLDDEEQSRAKALLDEDDGWFGGGGRSPQ